jgi:uncharacterized delta-60 repeat protein
MMKMQQIVRVWIACAAAALLAACGGGGGGGTDPTYTAGGAVTGLSGTLVVQNNGADDLTLTANGALTFSTALASGAAYAVTVRTQPAGQTCMVSNGSGNIVATNVTNVSVACSTNTYTVGGTVSGLAGSGLVLQDNGADNLSIGANGSFTFRALVASGATYNLTVKASPTGPSQTCTLGNGSGMVATANVTNVAVTCEMLASGMLDATFGSGGKFLAPPGYAQGVVIQADGKIVIVAWGPFDNGNSFTLTRFNTDGSVDPSFGIGGKTAGNLGGLRLADEEVHSLAMQSDGKLIVAGRGTGLVNGAINDEFALARYEANGQLDASFGVGGKVFSSFNNGRSSFLRALVIQADGKLVAVGSTPRTSNDYNFAIARFLADGSLDASFGSGGTVVTDFSQRNNDNSAEAIAIQADGKLVIAGWNQLGGSGSNIAPALARYNVDGSIDATFGTGGQVSNTSLIDNYGGPAAVAIQADGKIVLSKDVDTGFGDFALSRYNANGSPDTSFGINGVVSTDLSGGNQDRSITMLIQADGRVIVGGSSQGPNSSLFALARYQSDGSLDTTFGSGGKVLTDFGLSFAICNALAVQSDGKIVAVGGASDGGTAYSAVARYTP